MPPRQILHVDMDAFYASIEQRDHPEWRGRPVIVGGPRDARGVVSAASYEARAFGVHSALPSRTAAARCPDGVFVAPRMAYYVAVSEHLHAIFERFTPLVEGLALDEAFLDVTACGRAHGSAVTIGRAIVDTIRRELDLGASVGIAPNKFLAKLGSALEKPAGFVVLTAADARERIAPLPIERLWGVGRAMAARMHNLGYHTFGDLADDEPKRVRARLGRHGLGLRTLAQGQDDRPVVAEHEAKSIGRETTFAEDTADRAVIRATLYRLAESVGYRLRRADLRARTVSVKLRFDTFQTVTRDRSLAAPTNLDEVIFSEAWALAERLEWPRPKVRLIGVSTSNFAAGGAQLSLFDEGRGAREHVTRVVDIIRDQWGPHSIGHAGALGRTTEKDRGDG